MIRFDNSSFYPYLSILNFHFKELLILKIENGFLLDISTISLSIFNYQLSIK